MAGPSTAASPRSPRVDRVDRGAHRTRPARDPRPMALVWTDMRCGIVAHMADGEVRLDRIDLDPMVAAAPIGEPRRLENIVRFMHGVEAELVGRDDLLLLGPDGVHEQLAERLRERDARYAIRRTITCAAAAHLSDCRLVARLRRALDAPPRSRDGPEMSWRSADAVLHRYEEMLR